MDFQPIGEWLGSFIMDSLGLCTVLFFSFKLPGLCMVPLVMVSKSDSQFEWFFTHDPPKMVFLLCESVKNLSENIKA